LRRIVLLLAVIAVMASIAASVAFAQKPPPQACEKIEAKASVKAAIKTECK
jgi:hypothetical protein